MSGREDLPVCEAAYMADGRVLVGYTNRDENGGFTPVGDITAWWNARQDFYAEKLADTAELIRTQITGRLQEILLKLRETKIDTDQPA
jgi:hypothetical protein